MIHIVMYNLFIFAYFVKLVLQRLDYNEYILKLELELYMNIISKNYLFSNYDIQNLIIFS